MDKFAQRRGVLNKLREMSNVGGIAAEKFFNPEFEKVMNALRDSDDRIRSVATGEPINNQDPGEDMISLKELFKQAKSNFNRREYILAVNFLGRFHRKIESISNLVKELNFNVDQVHHDFLFKDLDHEQRGQLEQLRKRFSTTQYRFVKEAGIMDFLSNLTSTRGRALAAWEKRYPKQVIKFKNDVKNLLNRSEAMLNVLLSSLKEMASARAARKIDNYMTAAQKISNNFSNYDKSFEELYGANIKSFVNSFLDNQKKNEISAKTTTDIDAVPVENVNDNKELINQEIDVDYDPSPITERPKTPDTIPDVNPPSEFPPPIEKAYEEVGVPGSKIFEAPKIPKELMEEVEKEEHQEKVTMPDILPPKPLQSAHANFIYSLETLSKEDPKLLSMHIKKYAVKISKQDPKSAIQLLNIVKRIGK